jgi:hypothetical protein
MTHAAGQNGKRKTFSLDWTPIGTYRGKPSPTHIMTLHGDMMMLGQVTEVVRKVEENSRK